LATSIEAALAAGQYRTTLDDPSIQVVVQPEVTLIAGSSFDSMPPELQERWRTDVSGDGGELLMEAAGRACYQSWHNPADRTNHEYLANIIAQGHGSVLEHANYSVYLRGVSRSLTHELVRHRAGCAYSQLSQRYVDSSEVAFVVPPALFGEEELLQQWARTCRATLDAYSSLADGLAGKAPDRKKQRECARSVLPNCTETHIVMTANIRAWRHILCLRGSEHAEAEIRRLAKRILEVLSERVPLFWDYRVGEGPDGVPTVYRVDDT
jgi:thymidylate synthase (FAD)